MNEHRLKSSLHFLFGSGLLLTLAACGHSAGEIADIVSERDSLRIVAQRQQRHIDNLDEIVEIVNGSLDSIASQEGNLFTASTRDGGPASKEDVLRNLSRLEELVNSQKDRISKFEQRVSDTQAQDEVDVVDNQKYKNLIASMKQQLENKDQQIASLKTALANKDVDIAKLKDQTARMSQTIVDLDRRATAQQEALKRQDAMLNHCYMVIATKKELEQRGIIKKGKVVAQAALDRSKFSKVDIRKLTEISFSAKKPKLLTSMPSSSYEMTTDGNHNYTLTITNPTAFWSVSNYLIIQTN